MGRCIVVVVIALAAILGCVQTCSSVAEASSYQFQDQYTLYPNYYLTIAFFYAQDGSQITYVIQSYNDSKVDVLIMDMANFDAYTNGLSFTYLEGSSLDVDYSSRMTELGAFNSGQEYVILIDNSVYPDWGGMPGGSARFTYNIELYNVEIPAQANDALFDVFNTLSFLFPIIIFAVFVLVAIVIKRRKGIGTYSKMAKKQCPSCGSTVPAINVICPKCGKQC